jgi:predicted anti-sigma-YlaC factor YlaD
VHNSGPPHSGHWASDNVTADEVTCQQFVELVTGYFEGALAERTLSRVEEHLVLCDWCVTYAEQMQATIAALGELRQPASPAPPAAALAAVRSRKGAGG